MIVLDSSFLVAYHNNLDVNHKPAARLMDELLEEKWGSILLPEYVFLEVTTVLAMRRDLATAVAVAETLLRAKEIEFVPCTDIFLDAFDVFKNPADADLSFTDAAIVAIARQRKAQLIATFDGDFRKIEDVKVLPA